MVCTVVRTILGRAEEEIPAFGTAETPGDGHLLGRGVEALRPEGTVGSAVHAGHLADFAVPDPFANEVAVCGRGALVTHLRSHLVLLGQVGEQAGLIDGVGQRLLHIDVLAHGDGVGGHDGMRVVGGCYEDGIDALAHLVVHAAEVAILLGIGMTVPGILGIVPVDITEGDDVVRPLHVAKVGVTHASDTYAGDVQLVGGGDVSMALAQDGVGNYGQADGSSRSALKEFSS